MSDLAREAVSTDRLVLFVSRADVVATVVVDLRLLEVLAMHEYGEELEVLPYARRAVTDLRRAGRWYRTAADEIGRRYQGERRSPTGRADLSPEPWEDEELAPSCGSGWRRGSPRWVGPQPPGPPGGPSARARANP